jgi:hypothetical protein
MVLESWRARIPDVRLWGVRGLGLAHGLIGLVVLLQLLASGWPSVGVRFGLLAALGAPCLVLGAVFFWQVRRSGWALLFWGDAACLLQVVFNVLVLQDSLVNTLLSSLLFAALGGGLLAHPVRAWVRDESVGFWTKAERIPVSWDATCVFHERSCLGRILDVSRTGCGFGASMRIPVGERVRFSGDFGTLRGQVIREFASKARTREDALSPEYAYGIRFSRRIQADEFNHLRRLAESQESRRYPVT